MDLAFTPEEQKFRDEIRAWVRENLPKDIAHKVHNNLHLTRDDMQRWAKILGKKGWLGYGWPKQFGGPGWTAIQKHLFEEETALAGAPRIIPFGPVMVAPVIMAFGSPEQQKRFLPGIASGEVWWSQGYSEPGVSVRPIIMLDGGHEVNEVFFYNVEVPAENLIGEENKGWTYAKHLLSHERTNIADVNRSKRELERLKRIAKAENAYDDMRFRDEIARLEVDIVALEMLVLRVLSAEK